MSFVAPGGALIKSNKAKSDGDSLSVTARQWPLVHHATNADAMSHGIKSSQQVVPDTWTSTEIYKQIQNFGPYIYFYTFLDMVSSQHLVADILVIQTQYHTYGDVPRKYFLQTKQRHLLIKHQYNADTCFCG